METKVVFGLVLEQKRNDAVIDEKLFTEENITSKSKYVSQI